MKPFKVLYGFGWTGITAYNTVILNRNIKRYPSFEQMVLEHELKHATLNGNAFSPKDILHDLKDLFNFRLQLFQLFFMFRHPSAMIPFSYANEKGEIYLFTNPVLVIGMFLFFETIITAGFGLIPS